MVGVSRRLGRLGAVDLTAVPFNNRLTAIDFHLFELNGSYPALDTTPSSQAERDTTRNDPSKSGIVIDDGQSVVVYTFRLGQLPEKYHSAAAIKRRLANELVGIDTTVPWRIEVDSVLMGNGNPDAPNESMLTVHVTKQTLDSSVDDVLDFLAAIIPRYRATFGPLGVLDRRGSEANE